MTFIKAMIVIVVMIVIKAMIFMIVGIVMMYFVLGVALLSIIGVLIVFGIVSYFLHKKIKKQDKRVLKAKDKRMKSIE